MSLEQFLTMKKSAFATSVLDSLSVEIRLKRITKRQIDSSSMFNRLQVIIDQIEENLRTTTNESNEQMSPKDPAFIADHNYAFSNSSSGVSSATSSPLATVAPPLSSISSSSENLNYRFNRCLNGSAKRKIIDDDQEYQEFSAEDDLVIESQQQEQDSSQQYPQQIGDNIVLGPNGTEIDMRSYSSIIWSSAASATRQILGFVFSSDVLATHTLTGKPSPAFYGRERPAKMQLDPIKAADIIHCVRSQFKCTEREIRAAITTKCSDTSKKYKRRHQKQLESSNAMH